MIINEKTLAAAKEEKVKDAPLVSDDVQTILESNDRSTPWTLHYKAVHNVGAQNFMGPKDKQEAFRLANVFCADRNWRFIQVRPMFMDIDEKPQSAEERAKYK